MLDAAERRLQLGPGRAQQLEVVRVDEDGHALALDEAAQRAANRLEHELGVGLDGAARTFSASEGEVDGLPLEPLGTAAAASRPARAAASERRERRRDGAERLLVPGGQARRVGRGADRVGLRLRGGERRGGRGSPAPAGRPAAGGLQRGEVEVEARPWLHQLVVAAAGTARDDDGARLLEAAHDADDPALGLLDDAAALRRLELDLLAQQLGAALGHVLEDAA